MEHTSDNDINALYSVIDDQNRITKRQISRVIRAIQELPPSPQKTKIVDEIHDFSKVAVSELSQKEWMLLELTVTISNLAEEISYLKHRVKELENQHDTLYFVFTIVCKHLKNGYNL